MDKWEYTAFCSTASAFYTDRSSTTKRKRFSEIVAPSDWQVISTDAWETWIAPGAPVRTHGWKIHVGTTTGNMSRTLDAVVAACVDEHTTFKFVPTIHEYVNRNSKGADRSGSGKFATIYPTDDRQLTRLARRLARVLDGLPSPYILSDVRFRRGPVYFRYGGFIKITVRDESGGDIASIPDRLGVLKPDERSPQFVLPVDGRRAPRVVRDAIAQYELTEETPLDEYDGLTPLHFSNSGGVYEAHRDGIAASTTTLLKEARPHAGLDRRGRDAVERLKIEADALRLLEGTGLTPRVLNQFKAWEHEFLETEFLPGISSREWATTNYPFAVGGERPITHQRYLDAAIHVIRNMVNAMEVIHQRGIAIGDVHPGNILVDDDLNVRFIDLEDSRGLDDDVAASMYAIGYAPPVGFTPRQSDWFALSRTAASLFDISGALEILAPAHWETMMTRIRGNFGAEAVELIQAITSRFPRMNPETQLDFRPNVSVVPFSSESSPGQPLGASLLAGIRKARRSVLGVVYPGDPTIFSGSGRWNTLTGIAGVRLARRYGDLAAEPSDTAFLRALVESGATSPHLGLFSGEAGLLTHFESSEDTHDLADRVRQHLTQSFRQERRSDLCDGLAGIGLGLLGHGLTSRRDDAVEVAHEIGELLAARLVRSRAQWAIDVLTERPGLFHGHSGVAILFIALARSGIGTPDSYLVAAYECISRDLEHVSPYMDGMLGVKDGNRLLPYLAWGSSGILVAIELLRRSPEYQDAFEDYRPGLVRACSSDTYAYSGLLFGRAGQIAALSVSLDPANAAEASRQIALLPDELLTWEHEVFAAGENYLRLSTDYRSGNAGVVLALVAAAGAPFAWMPLSDPDEMFQIVAHSGGRATLVGGR
ncbi:class III lanthionine synthetase LanKC [Microbacterium sp. NPDC057650]|uniref:class III lanthionine synthetase LanKC n=1 Tax=unclassified Microbacterium TaxID=2609290 RepID=UPI003671131F